MLPIAYIYLPNVEWLRIICEIAARIKRRIKPFGKFTPIRESITEPVAKAQNPGYSLR